MFIDQFSRSTVGRIKAISGRNSFRVYASPMTDGIRRILATSGQTSDRRSFPRPWHLRINGSTVRQRWKDPDERQQCGPWKEDRDERGDAEEEGGKEEDEEEEGADATAKRGFPRDKIRTAPLSTAFRDIGRSGTERTTEGAWKRRVIVLRVLAAQREMLAFSLGHRLAIKPLTRRGTPRKRGEPTPFTDARQTVPEAGPTAERKFPNVRTLRGTNRTCLESLERPFG